MNLIGGLDTLDQALALWQWSETLLYLADGAAGLRIIDISDPESPR